MLVFGTKMHIVTFLIIIFEMLFFFYQIVHFLSRPSDKPRLYYLVLLYLLIQYNIISGLFPNPEYSIPVELQNTILFAAGFIMGMYFPYYFYKAFNLTKLKFYAYWGSVFFVFLPFIVLFLIPYYITKDLEASKKLLLIVAFLYASSFLYSLNRAIREQSKEQKVLRFRNEIISVYIGAIFWISLPVISYIEVMTNAFFKPIFNFNDTSQVIEMIVTNAGLVMMTVVFIRQSIRQSRAEYEKLQESEAKLQEMNLKLQEMNIKLQQSNDELLLKVAERTKELEIANEQRTNTFINLAHDIKTPLTLIDNFLEEYIQKPDIRSLHVVKNNIEKLKTNIVNFFDIERIRKGVIIYNHEQICNFSKILNEVVFLFQRYSVKKQIEIRTAIDDNVFIKADPESLQRIVNNIIENALKYTNETGHIDVKLNSINNQIIFSVKDTGVGIPIELHEKIFDPSFQIQQKKINDQGMGLGLSITKRILDGIRGEIKIKSDPDKEEGTEIIILFPFHHFAGNSTIADHVVTSEGYYEIEQLIAKDEIYNDHLPTLLIIEDNIPLLNFIYNKLRVKYNLYIALNGNQAIEKLKTINRLNLIISDVMMDNGDGFELHDLIYQQKRFKHIPFIFLTAKTEDKKKGLELGAIDYIHKPFSIDELIYKIDSILNNISEQINTFSNILHQSAIIRNSIEKPAQSESFRDLFEENCLKYSLTPQERKIVPLIAIGKTNKEIAEALFISDKTVKRHLQNMFEKVGAAGKRELIHILEFQNQNL